MPWSARITGDMTLSILDESGFKVLGVDMLRTNTMRAGDGGELLARTLNDLTLLARSADVTDANSLELWDASAGLSPTPWRIDVQNRTRKVQVRDATGRLIAERSFPRTTPSEVLRNVFGRITVAVERINLRRTNTTF